MLPTTNLPKPLKREHKQALLDPLDVSTLATAYAMTVKGDLKTLFRPGDIRRAIHLKCDRDNRVTEKHIKGALEVYQMLNV